MAQRGLPSPYFASGGRYVPNHESFGRMMVSEQLRGVLDVVAHRIRHQARANTHRSGDTIEQGGEHGGRSLADSYEVERGPIVVIAGQTGEPGPRISNRVVNRLRHAAAREFGRGGHTKGRGTRDLRRAGAVFGDVAGERG